MAMESKQTLDACALPLSSKQIPMLDQVATQKENLEKEKKALLEKTFYNQQQPAVRTKEELDKRIQKFEAQQKQAKEDGEEFSPQKLAYLNLCKATVVLINSLDEKIQAIEKEIQKFERSKVHIQTNINVDELRIHEISAVHVGHEFHDPVVDSNVQANIYIKEINAPNSHIHVAPIIYQAAPNPSPPIDHALVLQRLQKSLRTCYQNYTHLERLFDNTRVPIADSFINLALIKETEHKEKEKGLARDGLEKKYDGDGRERSRDYIDERMASHEQLYAVKEPLALTELFEPKDDTPTPNKILILGRAGIGKSILCQYLATQWASDAANFGAGAKDEEVKKISITDYLQQKFDAVFWLKLREVAAETADHDTLVDVIDRFCLEGLKKDTPTKPELSSYIDEHTNRILFILDGYDEIIDRIEQREYRHLKRILGEIACQQHVLLTSRPIMIGDRPIRFNRRLENLGFLNENIEAYVYQFMQTAQKPEQVAPMLNFLKSHPGVWGIAHIPINLELLSWLWSKGELVFAKNEIITLSKLYQIVVERIQEKYIEKACKEPDILPLNGPIEIKEESATIAADCANIFLERLAYGAMETESLFISAAHIKIALEETLIQYRRPLNTAYKTKLLRAATDKFGFLRTTGQGGKSQLDQEHYFIHLSFQEFYAARYIARILNQHPHSEEGEQVFQRVLTEKYTLRYQLMLWMSAGLLYQQGKKTNQFSSLLRFWRAILSQPRDMIGFHHNVLVIHCLDECEADDCVTLHKKLMAQQQKWFEFYRGEYEYNLYIKQFTQCSILLASFSMVTYLLQASQNGDRRLRSAALRTLGCLKNPSEAVIQALLSGLRDEDENATVACAAARALGNLNKSSEAVIEALLRALRDEDKYVRNAVARALAQSDNSSEVVIGALLRALRGGDYYVRNAVAEALAKSGNSSEVVIGALLRALQDEDKDIRNTAAEALGKLENLSEAVIEALLRALRDEDKYVRNAVARALAQSDNSSEVVIGALLRALRGGDYYVRNAVAEALAKSGNSSEVVIGALLRALQDEDKYVRGAAAEALGNLNNLSEAVVQALLSGLQDESASVKSAAAQALGKLNNPSEAVVQALLSGLRDKSTSVRHATTEALGKLNNPNEAVIEVLLRALENEDEYVRSAAAKALGNLNNPSETVIQPLLSALLNENEYTRSTAVEVLGKLNNFSEAVVQALLSGLQDESASVKSAAAQVLGKLNNPSEAVVQALLSALLNENEYTRSTAIGVLGKLNNPSEVVVEALLSGLQDESTGVRISVVQALGKLNPSEAVIEALLIALWDEQVFVRVNAAQALGKLNNPSAVVIEALFGALRDKRKIFGYFPDKVLSTISSTPKTIQATTYIFNQLGRDEKMSLAYFSSWIKQNYLLLIDHKKGNVIARQGHQNYSISLPPSDLFSLEKQIIAVAEKKDYPSEFYNLSGGSSNHAEKSILQIGTSMHFVSDTMWLVHLVGKKSAQRAFLVVEGIASEKYFMRCYELTQSQHNNNSYPHFFQSNPIGIVQIVKGEDFINELEQNKKRYQCKSWDIEPVMGRKLLELIEADIGDPIFYGTPANNFGAATSASSSEIQLHNCLTWAEAKLEEIGLIVAPRIEKTPGSVPVLIAARENNEVERPAPSTTVRENRLVGKSSLIAVRENNRLIQPDTSTPITKSRQAERVSTEEESKQPKRCLLM